MFGRMELTDLLVTDVQMPVCSVRARRRALYPKERRVPAPSSLRKVFQITTQGDSLHPSENT
jgi:hypothetical protein